MPTAWFDAPSVSAGAELAGRVLGIAGRAAIDLRPSGVRVRLDSGGHAAAVTAAADELGLATDPSTLQLLSGVIESPQPAGLRSFWRRVTGYAPSARGLKDPLCRGPAIHLRADDGARRPLRNRIHLDVVRPGAEVERADLGAGGGPYGVLHTDADGNEVDLVPGGPLGQTDWHAVFSAMGCYRTTSRSQQRSLASAAARIADDAGFPLLIDLRPGLVILDSGKDMWEAHGLDLDFAELAASVQAEARRLGATADAALPRFVQLFLDAVDVDSLRAFWMAALGYVADEREGVTDIYDPRRVGPVLVFQPIDTTDAERLAQRNRVLVELRVPADLAGGRVGAVLAAGGSVLEGGDGRWRLADPDSNELVVIAG